jgi:integrase
MISVRRSIVRGVVSSPKTYRHRFIPVAVDLYEALLLHRRTNGYVFSADGRGLEPLREPRKGLWRALRLAGLRHVGWHVLRHTFASQLVSESVSIYFVQALLGHTTVQMTMRYAHLAPSAMRGVVNVLQAAENRELQKLGQPAVNQDEREANAPHMLGPES